MLFCVFCGGDKITPTKVKQCLLSKFFVAPTHSDKTTCKDVPNKTK